MTVVSPETVDIGAQHLRKRAPVMGGVAIGRLRGDRTVVVELERIIAIVADRTVNLLRDARDGRYRVAAFRFRDRDFARAGCPLAERTARLPRQQPAQFEIPVHIGAMMLHRLETADRLAELDARP